MNSIENFWEELSTKAQNINVNESVLAKHSQIKVSNLSAKHAPDCKCSYCDPIDPIEASERTPSDPLAPSPEDFCAFLNTHCQEGKPDNAE